MYSIGLAYMEYRVDGKLLETYQFIMREKKFIKWVSLIKHVVF